MERRTFFKNGMLTGAALISGATLADSFAESASPKLIEKFNMKFSPEFGIFSELSGKDPIDQIKWATIRVLELGKAQD